MAMFMKKSWINAQLNFSVNALLTLVLFTLAGSLSFAQIARPKDATKVIMERILTYKNLIFDPLKPIPEIRYSSETELIDFQNDIEPQWGFKPNVITNAFIWKQNRIYLLDDSKYYESTSRCIDDSLAHELTHFIQYAYRGWDLNDESLEWDAVDTQTWYRENYCQ